MYCTPVALAQLEIPHIEMMPNQKIAKCIFLHFDKRNETLKWVFLWQGQRKGTVILSVCRVVCLPCFIIISFRLIARWTGRCGLLLLFPLLRLRECSQLISGRDACPRRMTTVIETSVHHSTASLCSLASDSQRDSLLPWRLNVSQGIGKMWIKKNTTRSLTPVCFLLFCKSLSGCVRQFDPLGAMPESKATGLFLGRATETGGLIDIYVCTCPRHCHCCGRPNTPHPQFSMD